MANVYRAPHEQRLRACRIRYPWKICISFGLSRPIQNLWDRQIGDVCTFVAAFESTRDNTGYSTASSGSREGRVLSTIGPGRSCNELVQTMHGSYDV
jgi:hypothetical protein